MSPAKERRKREQEMKIEIQRYSDSMTAVLHRTENEIKF
jgi:hypothetical protein